MVVPLHEDRHLGIEGAEVVVGQIVFVRGAVLVQRLRDLGLLGNGEVLPGLAVGKPHLGLDRTVGIDGVAGMQEEIRTMLAHRGEGDHAAVIGVDAPALAGDVAAPDEADVAAIGRCRAEAAGHRFAFDRAVREIAEANAVKDVLAGGQMFNQHLRGEVALGQRRDRRQCAGIPERISRRDLDQHLRRPVGARPHHAAAGGDVARLHAVGDNWPVRGARERGHRDRAERAGTAGEEAAAGEFDVHEGPSRIAWHGR
ncbi:hypothetical protein ABIF81_006791 [Bradyrhizobium daqingense]